eukprot:TCONS_00056768-protein
MVEIVTSAPGKIILCGEHAVVYGKEALAFSLSTTTQCCLKENMNNPSQIRIKVPDLQIDETYNGEDLEKAYGDSLQKGSGDVQTCQLFENEEDIYERLLSPEIDGTKKAALKLILVLYMHLAHSQTTPRKIGLCISFKSDLPIGAGLGSSASFAVATVSAMLVYTGVLPSNQSDWTEKDYEVINGWAYQSERIVHGTPSGIDNSISTYGQCVSFKSKKIERLKNFSELNLKVVLINTKKSRSTKALVTGVRQRNDKYPKIYPHIMDTIEQVTEKFKHNLMELSSDNAKERDEIYQNIEEETESSCKATRQRGCRR